MRNGQGNAQEQSVGEGRVERIVRRGGAVKKWWNRATFWLLLLCFVMTALVMLSQGSYIGAVVVLAFLGAVVYVARWIGKRGVDSE